MPLRCRLSATCFTHIKFFDATQAEEFASPGASNFKFHRLSFTDGTRASIAFIYIWSAMMPPPWPCRARHRGPGHNRCHYSPHDDPAIQYVYSNKSTRYGFSNLLSFRLVTGSCGLSPQGRLDECRESAYLHLHGLD